MKRGTFRLYFLKFFFFFFITKLYNPIFMYTIVKIVENSFIYSLYFVIYVMNYYSISIACKIQLHILWIYIIDVLTFEIMLTYSISMQKGPPIVKILISSSLNSFSVDRSRIKYRNKLYNSL